MLHYGSCYLTQHYYNVYLNIWILKFWYHFSTIVLPISVVQYNITETRKTVICKITKLKAMNCINCIMLYKNTNIQLHFQTMGVKDFTETVSCFMRVAWAAAAGKLHLLSSPQPIRENATAYSCGRRSRQSSTGNWLGFNIQVISRCSVITLSLCHLTSDWAKVLYFRK